MKAMCNEGTWNNTFLLSGPALALAMDGIPSIGHAHGFESSRWVAKTLPLTSGPLTIGHRQGDIRIRTHATADVAVTARIRTSISTSQQEADLCAGRLNGNPFFSTQTDLAQNGRTHRSSTGRGRPSRHVDATEHQQAAPPRTTAAHRSLRTA